MFGNWDDWQKVLLGLAAFVTALGGAATKIVPLMKQRNADRDKADQKALDNNEFGVRLRDELSATIKNLKLEAQGLRDELGEADKRERRIYSSFERLRGEVLRTIDSALTRLEVSDDKSRVVKLLTALKQRVEQFGIDEL